MFEREIRDLSFLKRWSIVRTIRDQTVAEHTYNVAMYANDIASWAGLDPQLHLSLLQQALWHDMDEMFTGDIPGPAKRSLAGDNRDAWKEKTRSWMKRVFGVFQHRSGAGLGPKEQNIVSCILKVADILDAACEMATERQLGNENVTEMVKRNTEWCLDEAKLLSDLLQLDARKRTNLESHICNAVRGCGTRESLPPVMICDY